MRNIGGKAGVPHFLFHRVKRRLPLLTARAFHQNSAHRNPDNIRNEKLRAVILPPIVLFTCKLSLESFLNTENRNNEKHLAFCTYANDLNCNGFRTTRSWGDESSDEPRYYRTISGHEQRLFYSPPNVEKWIRNGLATRCLAHEWRNFSFRKMDVHDALECVHTV